MIINSPPRIAMSMKAELISTHVYDYDEWIVTVFYDFSLLMIYAIYLFYIKNEKSSEFTTSQVPTSKLVKTTISTGNRIT